MYDSDEVRDKVREEMFEHLFSPLVDRMELPAAERAALEDAQVEFSRRFHAAGREYLASLDAQAEASQQFIDGLRELAERLAVQFCEAFRPLFGNIEERVREIAAAVAEIVEAIGWPQDEEEEDGFSWQRRPRRPEVRPVRGVDAVAAGRSPGMIVRTRIRGGRR